MDAQRQFRLGGRDDEDGSLNPKHVNLSSMSAFERSRRGSACAGVTQRVEEVQSQVRMSVARE
jgi:hypothetical protein